MTLRKYPKEKIMDNNLNIKYSDLYHCYLEITFGYIIIVVHLIVNIYS